MATEQLPPKLATFQSAKLSVVKGPDKGRQLILEGQVAQIGSDPSCELCLRDPSVSRRHAEVLGGPGGYLLRDLGSTNGIVVQGLQVVEARLVDDQRFFIGRSEVSFELGKKIEWPVSAATRFGPALAQSVVMRRLFAVFEKVASSQAPVLIEGEVGTGKSLLARALHDQSEWASGPFVVGEVSTGEVDAPSLLAEARGGTLYLDEVSALTPLQQLKVLRALEADLRARLVSSTARDLAEEVREGRFREDLALHLSAFKVRVPPLRARPDDVPELARHFAAARGSANAISEDLLCSFARHPWSGNVRELRNVVERLCAFPDLGAAALQDALGAGEARLPESNAVAVAELQRLKYHDARDRVLEGFERAYLGAHLKSARGMVARAASRMGLPRQSLYKMLKRLGMGVSEEK